MLALPSNPGTVSAPTAWPQEKVGNSQLGAGAIPDYLTISHRVRLVTTATVCAARGVDAEAVGMMVDDVLNERHIRFAFNVSTGRAVRELRFFIDEIKAPALTRKFTIHDVIARILGSRDVFRRGELELGWQMSSNLLSHLIRQNFLKTERGRLMRSTLQAFLFSRWSGNTPS
jgi:hypothetical protein